MDLRAIRELTRSSVIKAPPANAGVTRDMGSVSGSGRSPGIGNGNPPSILAGIIHGL